MGGYGKFNKLVFQMNAQAQVTGGAAEADVVGNHIVLPCKAKIVDVRAVVDAIAAGTTAVLKMYQGADKSGTAVLSTAGLTLTTAAPKSGKATLANPDKIWAAGTEFCFAENTTNLKTMDGLSMIVTVREEQVGD